MLALQHNSMNFRWHPLQRLRYGWLMGTEGLWCGARRLVRELNLGWTFGHQAWRREEVLQERKETRHGTP